MPVSKLQYASKLIYYNINTADNKLFKDTKRLNIWIKL